MKSITEFLFTAYAAVWLILVSEAIGDAYYTRLQHWETQLFGKNTDSVCYSFPKTGSNGNRIATNGNHFTRIYRLV